MEVALVEMIIPSQYHNITKEAYFDLVTSDKDFYNDVMMDFKRNPKSSITRLGNKPYTWQLRMSFPSEYYSNEAYLVSVMNDLLQNHFSRIWSRQNQKLEIRYLKHMNRPKVWFERIKYQHSICSNIVPKIRWGG